MASNITVHGLLLWASMGLLMPVGILTIRMSSKKETGSKEAKVFFYLHIVLQILSVVLMTIGAVMSIKNFENSFDNYHQKFGLALYGAMWVQALIGFFRPPRGNIRRSTWYFLHWLIGTTISLVGIINIYTGLEAYHDKTSRSTAIWTILFTAEICFLAFFYLVQDKWDYMQKQGLILGNNVDAVPSSIGVITQRENDKVLPPEPCGKRNALRNLFD
ncbi:cytochrome b561 domain-containing protein At4g18260 isoform X2 [Mangifera indica]|nr:cytochrome b561 domain-containing protein At4g18260 isoform X2 [Mangifera indica]XP_044496735.1 cytochrome b561 domain-containing protein At4g18260 isoform X2 [Mangifera indica]